MKCFILVLVLLHQSLAAINKITLKCYFLDRNHLNEISPQCLTESSCFFVNVTSKHAINDEFIYNGSQNLNAFKCLGFINSSLEQLPVDLFHYFPNIETLYAANLGLKSVNKNLFENASKVVEVHLEGNKLTELENSLFSGAGNLKKIFLSRNLITKIGNETFKRHTKTTAINQQLEDIDLSHNKLSEIEFGTFSDIKLLKNLILSHNQINLKFGLFPMFLLKLDLSYNNIKSFTLRQLLTLHQLQELKINGNFFEEPSVDFMFPSSTVQFMKITRYEMSDCFSCLQLADVLAYFYQTVPTARVTFDVERLNSPNILGISCSDDQTAVTSNSKIDKKVKKSESKDKNEKSDESNDEGEKKSKTKKHSTDETDEITESQTSATETSETSDFETNTESKDD
ncbi:CLUMA_CG006834, isoform A [Clunio marinus]|uniref:CLUMA_CG006834, isoform A n=1 Tax=Clunio marinus TaxID=568069 RepID=A0A1J1HZA9_9DIPT|nr:CLUMA_CG006834, isoform A [Clunio marinus]